MRTLPTFEELKEMGSSCLVGSYFIEILGERPHKPLKPKLKGECPTLIREYADQMELYNIALSECEKEEKERAAFVKEFEALLDEVVKDISGFNDVPEKYKAGLWYHASKGIEGDHYEIYCKLQEICSDVFGC